MKKKLQRSLLFNRVLSLALAFAMLLSVMPVIHAHAAEGDTTVYLKPNANWLTDNARFAIYYFEGSANGWTDMEPAGEDGYFRGVVPAGYSTIIFCRMNPGATENNWDNKWNQTSDLTLPTDGANCYTVPEGTWGEREGSWSTYTEAAAEEAVYVVAGSENLCGVVWKGSPADAPANVMTGSGGDYTKTFSDVAVGEGYQLKVVENLPDGTQNWIGDSDGNNVTFNVTSVCDVTVTFNKATQKITVTGEGVEIPSELIIDAIRAVGNGDGTWLNGVSWNPASDANKMTETSSGIYEITYTQVPAGTGYQVKFTANGTWAANWGGAYSESGAQADAVYNGDNIAVTVPYDYANVTLKLDLTGFDYSTKSGAKFTVTITEVEAPKVVDYYLFGYINGANYACEDDYENMGEYKFVNGKLTAQFDETSYVAVKTTDNADWYMTDGWQGEVTEVTLYNTKDLGDTANKLMVPGGVEVTFTLAENADDTLTLSYVETSGMNKVTIHYLKPETWGSTINAYVWATSGGAVPGYEDYNTWPGKAVSENTSHEGWYDLVVATEQPTAFNFIFNDGGNQTADLATGEITGNTELWVVGNEVMATAPGEWNGVYTYNVAIHFHNTAEWETVYAKFGQGDSWDAIEGYEQYKNNEFGAALEENADNSGWYTVSISVTGNDAAINGLFNNGNWGDGNQTGNWTTGTLTGKQEFWYDNGVLGTTAPEGWFDASRTIHIPGTFPGPSWDPSSNQMTYDPELGLYVYTFQNVPAANYEYKIAINGSWSENYGANGKPDGSNIAVSVPTAQDVTVYYNDETHYSVTSLDYQFLDISLTGTGIPEGTKLTDPGLTGIYSVTLPLAVGTYSDLRLSYDGNDYPIAEFELTEEKDVTFFYDPASGIYYCDAIPSQIDPEKVHYDSQDLDYKNPYGAVATGEEVTFSIETGAEVNQVRLIITGLEKHNVELTSDQSGAEAATRADIIKWNGTVSLNTIGEYDYYFVLSDGNGIKVYGDDDGFYGEGTVTDLDQVTPYDLVVYKAGFETPDWMKDAVIYQIFPDRFFDGDESNNMAQLWARGEVDYEYISDWYTLPENPEQEGIQEPEVYKATGAFFGDGNWSNEIYGGDLKGITQRIGYLKALGVNVIYLNPVFWSISSHRYDAVDYTQIDPILGTLGDFEELVAIVEANGMHIILDGVFNHVSDDSVYFDRYYKHLGKSEKIGAYPYWAYVYDYMADNGADQDTAETAARTYFTENYGITDYAYTEWFAVSSKTMAGTVDSIGLRAGKEVYSYEGWWGYDSMPVIKSTNGSEYQTGNWAQEIICNDSGDSVTQYWISKGMDGWRLDVANEVSDETWKAFRRSVKAMDSDAVIIGEIWDDATKYLLGDMYDSVMNYQFRNAATGFAMGAGAEETTKAMEKLRERYPEEAFYAMMNLVGSHDTTRLLSYLDGIGDDRNDKSLEAAFPTYENTSDTAKNRQYLVSFLQFTYAGAPTIYYGDEIGMVGADDPDDRRAFEWGKGNQELVEWYANLAAIREAYPALRTGSVETFSTGNGNVMGYVRRDGSDTLIVLANNGASAAVVKLDLAALNVDAAELTDLMGSDCTVSEGTLTVNVPALRGAILTENVKTVSVNSAALAPAYDSAYIVPVRSETVHVHRYAEQITVEPTCTEAGLKTCTCEGCGDSYTEEIPALGHNFVDGVCDRCGEKNSSVPTTPVKPIWQAWLERLLEKLHGGIIKPTEPTDPPAPTDPVKPPKPHWGGIFDWIPGLWN